MSTYQIPDQNEIDSYVYRGRQMQSSVIASMFRKAGRSVVAALKVIGHSFVAARQAETLNALSDRQLADIGLRREDIVRHIMGAQITEPTVYVTKANDDVADQNHNDDVQRAA